jgi:hypothetical protein
VTHGDSKLLLLGIGEELVEVFTSDNTAVYKARFKALALTIQ